MQITDKQLPAICHCFQFYCRFDGVKAAERQKLFVNIVKLHAADRPTSLRQAMNAVSGLPGCSVTKKTPRVCLLEPAEQVVRQARVGTPTNLPPQRLERRGFREGRVETISAPLNTALDWFVIHTKPRQESTAQSHLERQGFECYLPMLKVVHLRKRNLCAIKEPMFPRYLFIALDASLNGKDWAPIRSTRGVRELVRFGGRPAKVDFEIIKLLRARETEQCRHPEKPFKPGDRVRLVDGAFSGLESIYQAESGEQRSMILLELLSRPVKVTVSSASLRKIG